VVSQASVLYIYQSIIMHISYTLHFYFSYIPICATALQRLLARNWYLLACCCKVGGWRALRLAEMRIAACCLFIHAPAASSNLFKLLSTDVSRAATYNLIVMSGQIVSLTDYFCHRRLSDLAVCVYTALFKAVSICMLTLSPSYFASSFLYILIT
jgi:hypothetical protein